MFLKITKAKKIRLKKNKDSKHDNPSKKRLFTESIGLSEDYRGIWRVLHTHFVFLGVRP